MAVSFIRTIILYLCVVFAMRLMGKRQLGQLQPSELVVAIMISDLASIPMQSRSIPLLDGIVPIFTLMLMEILFSVFILKNETFRFMLTGRSIQIIKDGKIILGALKKLRLCVDDVTEQLRLSGYGSVSEIDSAFIETNGQMSIFPVEKFRPLCPNDVNLNPAQTHISYPLISDGKIRYENLEYMNLSEDWLQKKLKYYNVSSKNILLMTLDRDNNIFLQIKE